jgi:hypothetical protein
MLRLRTELLIALAMFIGVNVLSAAFQAETGINDGKGFDGSFYYTVAEQLSSGQALTSEAPFVYRVGVPLLAALVDKSDIVQGFKLVNLATNLVMTLLLVLFLRLYVRDWRIRLGLMAAFLVQWHGPIRYVYFNPVAVDNLMATFLLAGLLALHYLRDRASWLLIGSLWALAVLGTLVRESGLLLALIVPLARNPLRFEPRIPRIPLYFFVPLVLGLATFVGLHSLAHLTNAPSSSEAGGLIVPKSLPTYILGWFTGFGPLLILPLFTWRRSVAFLWQHQWMLGLVIAMSLFSSFQSPALQLQLQDTERYVFWIMPVLLVLIGRSLEEVLPLLTKPVLVALVGLQAVAERVFWPIPLPGDGDPTVFSHGQATLLLFTPIGKNVQYFDIFPAWMLQPERLILFGEYVIVAVALLGWLYWRATRGAHATRTSTVIRELVDAAA